MGGPRRQRVNQGEGGQGQRRVARALVAHPRGARPAAQDLRQTHARGLQLTQPLSGPQYLV